MSKRESKSERRRAGEHTLNSVGILVQQTTTPRNGSDELNNDGALPPGGDGGVAIASLWAAAGLSVSCE